MIFLVTLDTPPTVRPVVSAPVNHSWFAPSLRSFKVDEAFAVAVLLLVQFALSAMVATFTSSLLPHPPPPRPCFCMSFAISAAIWTLLPASGFVLKGLDAGGGGGGGAGRRRLLLPLEDWRVSPSSLQPPSSSTASSSISSSTTPDTSATPERSPQEGPGRWDSFDYLQHWYPVAWKVDMPVGAPTKQTLFDQDYAVVITPNDEVLAFVDKCPHRSAALSEGRLMSGGRYLQCAYHGWSFDASGTCVDIPQSSGSPQNYSPRACAKAVPAILHQGLVWLWPGPDPPHKMPPTVPELDDPAFKVLPLVRDFPIIDWSILLSNIMDPVRSWSSSCIGNAARKLSRSLTSRSVCVFNVLDRTTACSRISCRASICTRRARSTRCRLRNSLKRTGGR